MGLAEDVSMWFDSRQSYAVCGGTIILSSHYIFVGDIELWLICFVVEYSLLLQWREEAMTGHKGLVATKQGNVQLG
jgi:hypothetical protein